jgi:hypothetical protein
VVCVYVYLKAETLSLWVAREVALVACPPPIFRKEKEEGVIGEDGKR